MDDSVVTSIVVNSEMFEELQSDITTDQHTFGAYWNCNAIIETRMKLKESAIILRNQWLKAVKRRTWVHYQSVRLLHGKTRIEQTPLFAVLRQKQSVSGNDESIRAQMSRFWISQ